MNNRIIGIIAAMSVELDMILSNLSDIKSEKCGGIEFHKGKYENREVVCTVCGIGKVAAAMCAEAMIVKYSPAVILNTGVAGGIGDGLKMLDCTVADKCVEHDMDTSPLGDPVGMISGINKIFIEADRDYSSLLCECYKKTGKEPKVCTVASGDVFVADEKRKEYIKKTFGASVCDMESAAIAHVCYINAVPFVISRAISDNGNEDAKYDFVQMCQAAAEISCKAILKFIESFK